MRLSLAIVLLFSFALIVPSQAINHDVPNHSAPKLELRLAAVKSSTQPGERIKIRVELWNVGSEDVIVAQNLDSTFGNSSLSLILQTNNGEESFGTVGDSIPGNVEPDFEETFVTSWCTLNKGHFLGTYVYMDPIEFPHLRKPGRYQISAQYYSRGISSTPGWNGNYLKQVDIDKLPLVAFKGALSSNSINMRVIAREKTH